MMNLPNLPDSISKILFTVSLISFGYLVFVLSIKNEAGYSSNKRFNEKIDEVETMIDRNEIQRKRFELELFQKSQKISKFFNAKNPINKADGRLSFYELPDASNNRKLAEDSIRQYWNQYLLINLEESQLYGRKERIMREEDRRFDLQMDAEENQIIYLILSAVLLIVSMITWDRELNDNKRKPGKKPVVDYEDWCNSCCRNFSYNLVRGTEKEGEESKFFCADCYSEGEFTDYLSLESYKAYKEKVLASRTSKKERRRLERRFVSLVRWKTDEFEKIE